MGARSEDFPDHFGFFLPLAGISMVKQIRDCAFDIKATGRLNRLNVELLKTNPDWDTDARREGKCELQRKAGSLFYCRLRAPYPIRAMMLRVRQ